jgi:hypothetical protein
VRTQELRQLALPGMAGHLEEEAVHVGIFGYSATMVTSGRSSTASM